MATKPWLVPVLLLTACTEYDFYRPGVENPAKTDTETTEPVTETTEPTDTTTTPTDPIDTVDTGTETTTEPIAEAPVYANTTDQLFEVDPETGARTLVGTFNLAGTPVDSMVDIAIDLTGRMYGGTYEALYQIDPTTAALAKICDTDLRPYALAFTSDGRLFAGAGTEIVRVDLQTCAAFPLATSGGFETSGDLVGLPDGFLYWTVRGVSSDELVRVDATTGAAFWVGPIVEDRLFGLGYEQGQLYGFSSDGEIVRIDPGNAASTVLSSDGTSWWGATTNPVVW